MSKLQVIGRFGPPAGRWTMGDLSGPAVARIGGAGIHKGGATLMDVARDWAVGGERVYVATWANTGHALASKVAPWLDANCADVCLAIRSGVVRLRPAFVRGVQARFGGRAIRLVENHAEVVVCGDHVLLTSGTTVPSHIVEWFEVFEDRRLADVLRSWFDELPVADLVPEAPEQMTLEEILRGWNA